MFSRHLTALTSHDGVLDLRIPLGMPDQSVEVMLVVEPVQPTIISNDENIKSFIGCMKGMPSLSGDPRQIQQQMRDEWR